MGNSVPYLNRDNFDIPNNHKMMKKVKSINKYKKCNECNTKKDSLCKYCKKCILCKKLDNCESVHCMVTCNIKHKQMTYRRENTYTKLFKCIRCKKISQNLCKKCNYCKKCLQNKKSKTCRKS